MKYAAQWNDGEWFEVSYFNYVRLKLMKEVYAGLINVTAKIKLKDTKG